MQLINWGGENGDRGVVPYLISSKNKYVNQGESFKLPPAAASSSNWEHKNLDRPQLSCVFCSLNQHLGTQWSHCSWTRQQGELARRGRGRGRFVGKPQKNSTIAEAEPEPKQNFAFAANVFLLRFQFKICAKVARNVPECSRRRKKEGEGERRKEKKVE